MGCNCGNKTKVTSGVPTVNGLPDMCACGKPKNECCCNKPKNPCCDEPKPCKQSHDVTLVQSVYTTTVEATNSWAMPAVDDCVQLHLKDVVNILPGAILWNQSVGQLKVSSYDSTTGYVLACNNGDSGNAEEGTAFPSCMSFHVGIPVECNCDDDYAGVCLAADMTSPGEGETTEVSVTTVSGLFIGDVIDIAGYMYRITAINDVNTITVKNEGYGAPIGTVIKNDPNCTGKKCTVKITVVNSDDPCTKDPVQEGVLVVCDDGEKTTLQGTADSQIAVWDNNDKKWKLKTVKIEDECTNLTVDLTLDPLVNLYIINVLTTAIFQVNDIVYLGGHKFKVNSIVNSTQMRIEVQDTISAITVIEEGEAICLGDCCESLVIPEVPSKYSGIDSDGAGTNIMRFTTEESASIEIRKVTPWSDDDYKSTNDASINSKLPSITIANPTDVSNGKSMTVVGTITVAIQGHFKTDTHTYTESDSNKITLCTCNGVGAELSVMPKLNNTNLFTTAITTYRQYEYNSDTLADDKGREDIYSRNITIPICCTVTKGATNTITLDGTVIGYELRIKSPNNISYANGDKFTNNASYITVNKVQTTVALAWILQ